MNSLKSKESQKHSQAPRKNEHQRLEELTELERAVRAKGFKCVVGVDEAGRGPLAGPVVAAACSIPEGVFFPGINDSKLLSSIKRQTLFKQLLAHEGVFFGIGVIDSTVIDRINILQAALQAMREAVTKLPLKPDCLLVDGNQTFMDSIYSEAIIKGDSRSQMIAAASILAKETRDEIMLGFHEKYPHYGFHEHKGYATEKHRAALAKYGPCPIHRLSFAPLHTSISSP